jgi:hypothetical protein
MGDLLDEDYSLVERNARYRCLDKLLAHKPALFAPLAGVRGAATAGLASLRRTDLIVAERTSPYP